MTKVEINLKELTSEQARKLLGKLYKDTKEYRKTDKSAYLIISTKRMAFCV